MARKRATRLKKARKPRARQTTLQRGYNNLRKAKRKFCEGKLSKTEVNTVAARYVKLATAQGQTRKDAQAKAKRVLSGGCSMSSYIAKKKK